MRMNPPEFHWSNMDEDPQSFINEVRKITQIMNIAEEESVELKSYWFKDISYDWVTIWTDGRDEMQLL